MVMRVSLMEPIIGSTRSRHVVVVVVVVTMMR